MYCTLSLWANTSACGVPSTLHPDVIDGNRLPARERPLCRDGGLARLDVLRGRYRACAVLP